jgi:hypothetical protein
MDLLDALDLAIQTLERILPGEPKDAPSYAGCLASLKAAREAERWRRVADERHRSAICLLAEQRRRR